VTIEELAKKVATEVWGFIPNRSVKPVHFANGFFRALSGRVGNPVLLHRAAGGYLRGNARHSTEALREDMTDRLDTTHGTPTVERLKVLRSALDLVLGQDRALFPSEKAYSFTLTHWRHSSSDASDQRTGRFLAGVLTLDTDTAVIDTLRSVLDRADDAIYQLTAPLLDTREMGPGVDLDADETERLAALVSRSAPLRATAKAIECLTEYAPHLEKSAFLHRLVTLGGFALYHHVVNATSEAQTGRRAPMLLCAPEPSAEVLEASRATYLRAKQRIAHAFEEGLTAKLHERGEDTLDAAELEALLHGWLLQPGMSDTARRRAEKLESQFRQEFAAERVGTDSVSQAFVRAAVSVCFAEIGVDSPERFATFIGTHIGLIGPFRGPGEKYYRPLPQFLDALVGALLRPDERELPIEEFWLRAWERFGILSGARAQHDAAQLNTWGVRQASINRLTANAVSLNAELARLGYARTFADGATLIQADV
jgi:hypothetical protein